MKKFLTTILLSLALSLQGATVTNFVTDALGNPVTFWVVITPFTPSTIFGGTNVLGPSTSVHCVQGKWSANILAGWYWVDQRPGLPPTKIFSVYGDTQTNHLSYFASAATNPIPSFGYSHILQTNLTLVVAGTNTEIHSVTNSGVTTYTVSSTAIGAPGSQTEWPLSSITNANHLTNWALLNTNLLGGSSWTSNEIYGIAGVATTNAHQISTNWGMTSVGTNEQTFEWFTNFSGELLWMGVSQIGTTISNIVVGFPGVGSRMTFYNGQNGTLTELNGQLNVENNVQAGGFVGDGGGLTGITTNTIDNEFYQFILFGYTNRVSPSYSLQSPTAQKLSLLYSGTTNGTIDLSTNLIDIPAMINVKRFGAKGDGVNNDAPAIQAAINSAPQPRGAIIWFDRGRYNIETPLFLTNNVTLTGDKGAEIYDALVSPPHYYENVLVWFSGVYPDGTNSQDGLQPIQINSRPTNAIYFASANSGATSIVCSVSGSLSNISAGDWLLIAEGSWDAPGGAAQPYTAHANRRLSYKQAYSKSGDTLNLDSPLDYTFNSSLYEEGLPAPYTNGIIRIKPLTNAHVVGLKLTCVTNAYYAFNSAMAVNCSVQDCIITHHEGETLSYANDCHRFIFRNNTVKWSSFGGFNRGTHCLEEGNTYERMAESGEEMGEGANHIIVRGNRYFQCNEPYVITMQKVFDVTIENNEFNGSGTTGALWVDSANDVVIRGNTFKAVNSVLAISVGTFAIRNSGIVFENNIVEQKVGAANPFFYHGLDENKQAITYRNNIIKGRSPDFNGSDYALDDRAISSVGNTWNDLNGQQFNVPSRFSFGSGAIRATTYWPLADGSYQKNFDLGDTFIPYTTDGSGPKSNWWAQVCVSPGSYGTLAATGWVASGSAILIVTNGTPPAPGRYINISGWGNAFKVMDYVRGTTTNLLLSATNTGAAIINASLTFTTPAFKTVEYSEGFGTAARSNANAFLSTSQAGTAAYSNSSDFVLTSAAGTAAYSDVSDFLLQHSPRTNNLIAHWTFDETSGTRTNSMGTGNLSVDGADPGYTNGIFSNAVFFTLFSTQSLILADSATFSMAPEQSFTIAFWVKFNTTNNYQSIIDKNVDLINQREYAVWLDNTAHINFWVGNGTAYGEAKWGVMANTNQWYFIVARHDAAANLMSLFVDNLGPTNTAWSGGSYDSTGDLHIGRTDNPPAPWWFDGALDSLSIWKRSLENAEIATLYNSGAGKNYNFLNVFGGTDLLSLNNIWTGSNYFQGPLVASNIVTGELSVSGSVEENASLSMTNTNNFVMTILVSGNLTGDTNIVLPDMLGTGGSGQTNLTLVVGGTNAFVTPTTNSGVTTFTVDVPASGEATNVIHLAAGANVSVTTNSDTLNTIAADVSHAEVQDATNGLNLSLTNQLNAKLNATNGVGQDVTFFGSNYLAKVSSTNVVAGKASVTNNLIVEGTTYLNSFRGTNNAYIDGPYVFGVNGLLLQNFTGASGSGGWVGINFLTTNTFLFSALTNNIRFCFQSNTDEQPAVWFGTNPAPVIKFITGANVSPDYISIYASNVVASGTFHGDGSGLTNLPAGGGQTNLTLVTGNTGITVSATTNSGVTTYDLTATGSLGQTNLTLFSANSGISLTSSTNSGITSFVVKSQTNQTVSLTDFNAIHALLWATNKLWGCDAASAPGKVVRFNNPDDLSDYSVTNMAWNYAYELVFVPSKGKIYAISYNHLVEVDPTTLDQSTVLTNNNQWSAGTADDTYFYVVGATNSNGNESGLISRFALSDWSHQGSLSLYDLLGTNFHGLVHAIKYDTNGFLFATAIDQFGGSPGWMVKIRTSDFTVVGSTVFAAGDCRPTDDLALAGDYAWVGLEATNGYFLRIHKNNMTVDRIYSGVANSTSYGMFFDGEYVWNCIRDTNILQRIDPVTGTIWNNYIGNITTESNLNEVAWGDDRFWVSSYQSPSKVTRVAREKYPQFVSGPNLTPGKERPLVAPYILYTNGVVSYVRTNGDDATFVRGDITLPAKTIAVAVSNMQSGDSLFIAAGYYNNSNRWLLPTNSMIYGAGNGATIVSNWFNGSETMMIPSDNSWIKDFAVIGNGGSGFAPMWGRTDDGAFTNALLSRMAFSNHIDCLFVEQDAESSAQVDSCIFQTKWDAVVWRITGTHTDKTLNIYNTETYNNAGTTDWGGYDVQGIGVLNAYDCFYFSIKNYRMFYLFDGGTISLFSCHFTYPPGANQFFHLDNGGDPNVLNLWDCDAIAGNFVTVESGTVTYGNKGPVKNYALNAVGLATSAEVVAATNGLNTALVSTIQNATNGLAGLLTTDKINATNKLATDLTTDKINATNGLAGLLSTDIVNATNGLAGLLTTDKINATNKLAVDLTTDIHNATNESILKVRASNIVFMTNAAPTTFDMSKMFQYFSTNANFTLASYINVDTTGTNVQPRTMVVTNTTGPTPITVTMPGGTILANGTGANSLTGYITNQAVISVLYYPGAGTNAIITCVK